MTENLGTCCACGGTKNVRNIYMLDKKAPMPGRGWGCVQCGLPMDGAMAVICDGCHDMGEPLYFACEGYPGKDGRVPIGALTGGHEHDLSKHRAEMASFDPSAWDTNDDDDDDGGECGRDQGYEGCQLAGTEYCEFECPFRD